MNKQEPLNLFAMMFAAQGARTIIPPTGDDTNGRANLASGFPPVTQLPVSQGGVAPQRLDFNGIFYMLSAFAFFAQSGGIFSYKDILDYDSPAVVFYNNSLWYCLKGNGPGTDDGLQEPGESPEYWQLFVEYIAEAMINAGINISGADVGDVKMHYGTTAPDGWLWCNGSTFNTETYPLLAEKLGSDRLPDFRGLAPRGYDPTATNDPDGETRTIGSYQTDAGRNVTGQAPLADRNAGFDAVFSGCFRVDKTTLKNYGSRTIDTDNPRVFLDASLNWGSEHTSTEFRMANFSILFCIKHD